MKGLIREHPGVLTMCATTLGRLKAKAAIGDLNANHPMQMTASPLMNALRSALEQITGKKQPVSEGQWAYQTGWFLEPDR